MAALADEVADAAAEFPTAGQAVAGMESYDRLVAGLMKKWKIPGGQVAVVKSGRLVLARGYGWANVEAKQPVQPNSLFRIASVSKPITATAILRLVQEGRLDLDAKAFGLLPQFPIPEGSGVDPRLGQITLRQLLTHTAGWDRDKSFDPMFIPFKAAEAQGASPPADAATIIRYMLRQPLDFDPGQKYAYSNFGYCLLGRILQQATGKDYEQAVRELVLQRCGAASLRLGHTRPSERGPDEVAYYDQPPDELARSVFADVEQEVPWPDGGFYLEAMDAHGGWIGSATDLLRFATAIEGRRGEALLEGATLELLAARPASPVSRTDPTYYGLGWMVRPTGKESSWRRSNWWHTGSLPGTAALLVRTGQDMAWAALFNSRAASAGAKKFAAELDALMWEAAGQVEHWPEHDLFERQQR
jgi:N-acyl-D-amino-acid deacylase